MKCAPENGKFEGGQSLAGLIVSSNVLEGDDVTAVKKLTVLLCGYEILPRSVSIRGGGNRFVMSVPISTYLLETAQGFAVFDTGFNSAILRDPDLRQQHITAHGWEAPVV